MFIAYEDVSSEKPSLSSGLAYYRFYLVYQNDVKMLPIDASSTKFLADDDVNVEVNLLPVVNLSPFGNQEVYYRVLATFSVAADYQNSDADNDDWLGFYCTNLPVFEKNDQESIAKYLENGDYSGAINSDDVKGVEYDETIELPHDLKFSGEVFFHKPLFGGYCFKTKNVCGVSWQIPDDNTLLYDLDVCGTFNTTSGQKTTQWHSLARHSSYSGDAVIFDFINGNLNLNLLDNSIASYVNSSGWDVDEMVTLSVRVRNVKDGKCSNWVVLSMNQSGSGSAHVEDTDGNVVDNDEYTGSDGYDTNGKNGGSVADDNNTVVDTSNISINGIMGYIKSGFGLLGSGGIIALMSQTYLYLPGSIWTIIKFFISMLVTICLIKLVKEVLL